MPKINKARGRVTLPELVDLEKLSAFMGWPALECAAERWASYRQQLFDEWQTNRNNQYRLQTYVNFIRQCAREEFGIKGKSVNEVWETCLAARPDLYTRKEKPQTCQR